MKNLFHENYLNFSFFLYFLFSSFLGNHLTCDCRLRWVFNLSKNTKNVDLRESLHRIQCVLAPKPTHLNTDFFGGIENTFKKPLHHNHNMPEDDLIEYNYEELSYGADVETSNVRIGTGQLSSLLKLKSENLPCPQELIEPTELPLQRESIGFMGDLSWRSNGNRCFETGVQMWLMGIASTIYFFVVSHF